MREKTHRKSSVTLLDVSKYSFAGNGIELQIENIFCLCYLRKRTTAADRSLCSC